MLAHAAKARCCHHTTTGVPADAAPGTHKPELRVATREGLYAHRLQPPDLPDLTWSFRV